METKPIIDSQPFNIIHFVLILELSTSKSISSFFDKSSNGLIHVLCVSYLHFWEIVNGKRRMESGKRKEGETAQYTTPSSHLHGINTRPPCSLAEMRCPLTGVTKEDAGVTTNLTWGTKDCDNAANDCDSPANDCDSPADDRDNPAEHRDNPAQQFYNGAEQSYKCDKEP